MRRIAIKHIEQAAQPAKPLSPAIRSALLTGTASVGLYILLYFFSQDIRHLAEATIHGDKGLFYVPIVIALLFSLVHGAFTGHFWDALGLKAKH